MHAQKSHLSRIATTIAAAVVLVAGLDMVSYAATGKSMLLGKSNSAGTTTNLTNTGRGAVLNLKGGAPYPPLVVNSKKKVVNFNADTVDGLNSSVLEPGVFKITMATKGSTPPASSVFRRLSLPAGTYQADISGIATNPTASGDGTITCLVADQEKVFADVSNPNYSGLFAVQADLATVYGGFALFGTSALFTVPAGHHVIYTCTSSSTDAAKPVVVQSPMVATFRKVIKVTSLTGAVWTPPTPRTAQRLVPQP